MSGTLRGGKHRDVDAYDLAFRLADHGAKRQALRQIHGMRGAQER
jgi:hypothetical protein